MTEIKIQKNVVIQVAVTFLLLALLCMPGIVYFSQQKDYVNLLYTLIIPLSIFMVPIILFRKIIRWYVSSICIFILLAPAATLPIIFFGLPVKKDILLITFNTTYREASEFLGGYLLSIILIYTVYIIATIMSIKSLPQKISFKRSAVIAILALLSLVCITVIRNGLNFSFQNFKGLVYDYYPFHLTRSFYSFYKEESAVKRAEKHIRQLKYRNVTHEVHHQRQIYILLIGESSRYDHWEINGYNRPTSPRLMNQKRLLSYRNVSASGVLTELSVPQIITGVTAEHYSNHLSQAGIVKIFSQAGFKTYWISSQTDYGNIRMHANIADSTIWVQNVFHSTNQTYYDMELVNRMKEVLDKYTGNCLLVIHPLGSHFNFNYRYPCSFEYFKPVWHTNSVVPTKGDKKAKLVNAYDNSILYTDAVLDSAIKVLNSYNCISAVLYVSDHGENLLDDNRNLVLHAPKNPSKYIAHIPLFIYGSEKYVSYFHSKWNYLKSHIDSKISNNQTFETLVDMAGIKYNGQNLSNSLASKKFIDSQQKILGPNNKIYLYSRLK